MCCGLLCRGGGGACLLSAKGAELEGWGQRQGVHARGDVRKKEPARKLTVTCEPVRKCYLIGAGKTVVVSRAEPSGQSVPPVTITPLMHELVVGR